MGEVRVYGAPSEMAGKWIREADHDAALRRAKAEGWREAAMELHSKSKAIRTEAVTWGWGETAEQLSRIAFECDARATQIERGE